MKILDFAVLVCTLIFSSVTMVYGESTTKYIAVI
ncbi:hypothetical protein IMSAG049_01315 [Clostridiales bacterium]|nr:hypothetical protein IMSAG049_01315 [Clostridiales bacterium]